MLTQLKHQAELAGRGGMNVMSNPLQDINQDVNDAIEMLGGTPAEED